MIRATTSSNNWNLTQAALFFNLPQMFIKGIGHFTDLTLDFFIFEPQSSNVIQTFSFLPPYALEFSVCLSSFFFHNAKLITNNWQSPPTSHWLSTIDQHYTIVLQLIRQTHNNPYHLFLDISDCSTLFLQTNFTNKLKKTKNFCRTKKIYIFAEIKIKVWRMLEATCK